MTARHTSAEAYHLLGSKAKSDCDRIADFVLRRGPCTRREIAAELQMETSSVAGRVNDLMKEKLLLELDDLRPCPITKRRVNWLVHRDHAPGMQLRLAV